MNRKIFEVIAAVLVLSGSVFAAGESGGAFLRIPVGARASALGGAYGGISGSVDSIYWNPAGITELSDLEISLSYAAWLEEINYQNLAVGKPLAGGVVALGVNFLASGDMARFDSEGFEQPGSATASDLLLLLAYAREVKGFNVAPALKIITSQLDGESASAFGLDLGVQKNVAGFNIGLSLHNLGTQLKFREEGDPLPFITRLGAAYPLHAGGMDLKGLLDISFSRDVSFDLNAGVEASRNFGDIDVFLRSGFRLYAEKLGGLGNFGFGGGLRWNSLSFDYSFSPYGDLGSVHRVSTGYLFGEPRSAARPSSSLQRRGNPDRLYNEGVKHLNRGDYLEAIEMFTEVLILDPNHPRALNSLDEANRKLQ